MNGAVPGVDDKFTIKFGKKVYLGSFGGDGMADIALVAERVAGQGVYTGLGAANTWEFIYRLDAAVWVFENQNADFQSLAQYFVNQANLAMADYFEDESGGEVPEMPTELVAALQWFCKYRINFDSTGKLVLS